MSTEDLPWDKTAVSSDIQKRLIQTKKDLKAHDRLNQEKPKWKRTINKYTIVAKSVFFTLLFVGFRELCRSYIDLDQGIYYKELSSLISGSLFFFSFMINGVLADYKLGEKIPSMGVDALEEFVHCGLICLRQSVQENKCTAQVAADLHALLIASASEMLCLFRISLSAPEKTDFMPRMRQSMAHIDCLNQHMIHIVGPNPAGVQLVAQPKQLRSIIRSVRLMIDTEFWAMGYLFVYADIVVVLVVLMTLRYETLISEYLMIPALVYIFVFVQYMIGELEDPFAHGVSQYQLDEMKSRFISEINAITGMVDKVHRPSYSITPGTEGSLNSGL